MPTENLPDAIDLKTEELTDHERETLVNVLKVLRYKNWFGNWLYCEVKCMADHSADPKWRYPTPPEVIKSLESEVSQFEIWKDEALQLIEQRPDVLGLD